MSKDAQPDKQSRHSKLPKGAYRLPTGGYLINSETSSVQGNRQIRVMAVHREQPDAEKIAKVLIAVALKLREQQRARTNHAADEEEHQPA